MIVGITLVVTAETAVSIGAGGSSGTIADKVIVRDGWGRPIIPGSQVKGRTRHAAESIAAALGLAIGAHFDDDAETPIRAIFGSPSYPSPLRFVDLIAFSGNMEQIETPEPLLWRDIGAIRPSVSISRRRGNAEDARLLFQETAPEGLQFGTYPRPSISGMLDSMAHLALLWAALRLWPRWGGAKSRGLGWSRVEIRVTADGRAVDEAELGVALRQLEQSREN